MKYKLTLIILSAFLVRFQLGCEEPSLEGNEQEEPVNTLSDPVLGDEVSLDRYFFDFENGFNIKYNRYDAESIINPGLFDPEVDTLNFRSYSAYNLEYMESNLSGFEMITPQMVADSGYAEIVQIDSLTKDSVAQEIKITFNSEKVLSITLSSNISCVYNGTSFSEVTDCSFCCSLVIKPL